jgi:hypothetical protein
MRVVGELLDQVTRLMREPMEGTAMAAMVQSDTRDVRMDFMDDFTESDRTRVLIGWCFGLQSAVLVLTTEIERLVSLLSTPFDDESGTSEVKE